MATKTATTPTATPELANGTGGNGLRVRTVEMTPGTAQSYLNVYGYERQRGIRRHHVEYLAAAMRRGEFKPGVIELRKIGDRVYMIDGYHRLNAIIKAGIPQELLVVERDAATIEEVDADYARTDRGMLRSMGDSVRAYGIADEIGLGSSAVNKMTSAMVPIIVGFQSWGATSTARKTAELRIAALRDWQHEIRLYTSIVGRGSRRQHTRMLASPVAAVALVTLRYQEAMALPWWQIVVENDGLRRGEPAHVLVEYLIENVVSSRSSHVYAKAVANTWNAHYEGRQLSILKLAPEQLDRPIRIAGTPYDGKTIVHPYELGIG